MDDDEKHANPFCRDQEVCLTESERRLLLAPGLRKAEELMSHTES
jgi:hypothetical protein